MQEKVFTSNPRDFIVEFRQLGKTDQEIYDALVTRYSDKKAIAKLILGTPKPFDKEDYKAHNMLLFVLLIVSIILKMFTGFSFAFQYGGIAALFGLILFPLLNIYIAYGVYNYVASVYKIGGILSIISILRGVGTLVQGDALGIIDILFASTLAILFFYLKSNLFPNFSDDNLKLDASGNYIMPQSSQASKNPYASAGM